MHSLSTGASSLFHQPLNKTNTEAPCPGCITEYLHLCSLINLTPDTLYYYQVGNEDFSSASAVSMFTSKRSHSSIKPLVIGLYGDLGLENEVSLSRLEEAVALNTFEVIMHVGDFAYDLDDEGGVQGQQFMQSIESLASRVPYITCIGNHEWGPSNSSGALQHYIQRFGKLMPGKTDGMYFSIDIGLVHVVSLSTEVYFWQGDILGTCKEIGLS